MSLWTLAELDRLRDAGELPELLRLLPVPAPPRALEELARAVASTEGFGADLSPLFASSPDRQFGEAAGAVLAFIDEALAREAGHAG